MADNSNENIFSSLRTLIWGAFIGVVSFQILAPEVWGYLHRALGIPNNWSYWIFTVVYFLTMPVIVLLWLKNNKDLITRYLPVYKGEISENSKLFLNGLFVFIAIQLVVTGSGFFIHWGWMVYVILAVYTIVCGIFLMLCFHFCKDHINEAFSNITNMVTDFEPTESEKIIEGKEYIPNRDHVIARAYKNANTYFFQLFRPAILVYSLLFPLAFCFILNWHTVDNRTSDKTKSSFDAGEISFKLQSLNDSLQKNNAFLPILEASVNKENFHEEIDSAANNKTSFSSNSKNDTINPFIKSYYYNLKSWGLSLNVLDSMETLHNTVFTKKIETLSYNTNFATEDLLGHSSALNKGDETFVRLLRTYLSAASDKITKVSKATLGRQLRSVQAKGMIMLISLFFTLLALYIFLKVINRIQLLGQEIFNKKNIRQDVWSDNKNQDDLEHEIADSGTALNSLWLFITITAWLLLPIFKPVIDEDINLNSPYKAFTVAGAAPTVDGLLPADISSYNRKDTIRIFNRYDTLQVNLLSTPQGLDSPSVNELLKEIIRKTDSIDRKAGNIDKRVDGIDKQLKN